MKWNICTAPCGYRKYTGLKAHQMNGCYSNGCCTTSSQSVIFEPSLQATLAHPVPDLRWLPREDLGDIRGPKYPRLEFRLKISRFHEKVSTVRTWKYDSAVSTRNNTEKFCFGGDLDLTWPKVYLIRILAPHDSASEGSSPPKSPPSRTP